MIFKQLSLGSEGIEIRELDLELGIIFQETDQLVEDFSPD